MFLGGVGIGGCIYLRPRRGGSLTPSLPPGLVSPGSPLFSAASSREHGALNRVCRLYPLSRRGNTGQKSLALARVCNREKCAFRLAWNSRSQPVCQGPMAEAELIIPKRREGGRDERTRFRVSRSWASLFLPPLSTYGEASSIQGRGLVDSWNRFSLLVFLLFMRFLHHHNRGKG